MTKLKLTAVGLGPGDPELVTLKGLNAIKEAQVIFVPRSRDGEMSLALRIARPWIDDNRQQIVELPLPMTRNSNELVEAWQAAADDIAASMQALEPVSGEANGVYLLLGDPLLYGTFTYIWQVLSERYRDVAIEIIPGVTSFAASAARGQMLLSTTSDRVVILPASYETDGAQVSELLSRFDTVIFMKVGPVLPQMLTTIEQMGLLGSTLYAERVGMPEEQLVSGERLRELRGQQRPYLSLLIVRAGNDSDPLPSIK